MALQVELATGTEVPPSSLRLWQKVLPNVDSVYLGDFDTVFKNQFFWSYKDGGLEGFSRESIARSGVALAYTLRALASGTAPPGQANATVRPCPSCASSPARLWVANEDVSMNST
jgi:hypothetical protein